MRKGKVTLFLGPMFSGKSTALISEMRKAVIAQKSVCLIRPSADERKYLTHDLEVLVDAVKYPIRTYEELTDVAPNVSVICVDEAQFIRKLYFVHYWANKGHTVFVAALNGDRYQKPWEEVQALIPLVDNIRFFHAVCSLCGKDASYSYNVETDSAEQVLIGGKGEGFKALCRTCLYNGRLK